ncbi:MAG: hypothetical protein RMM30_05015 [Armatimonadota bacterium]|nr:hypothetical protein [Armatimonadota bacterium]MDW8155928.1 hypothetical protein [Armatimonadota bacterium]
MAAGLSAGGLVRAWAAALVGSVVVNELLRHALVGLLAVPATFAPFTRPAVLFWTTVGVTGAAGAFALVARWAADPARAYRRLAAVVLVLSWVPDLLLPGSPRFPEATWPLAAGLALLHVPPALLCVWLLPRWGLRSHSAAW